MTNPELAALHKELEAIRSESARLLSGLSDAALNHRPSPGIWSVGQQFDHLNRTDSLILPGLSAAIADMGAQGQRASGPFRYRGMERMMIRAMNPSGWMRLLPIPVPPLYEPTTDPLTVESLAAQADQLRSSYLALIEEADGLDLTMGAIPSPANGKVNMCPGAWLHCIVAHNRYHLTKAQAAAPSTAF